MNSANKKAMLERFENAQKRFDNCMFLFNEHRIDYIELEKEWRLLQKLIGKELILINSED